MADIEDGIVARLAGQVTSLANKIYPAQDVPINTAAPYVAYQRISTARYGNLIDTAGDFEPTFQFTVYGTGYSNMRSLRTSIRQAFENALGEYATGAPYVQRVTIENEIDSYNTETQQHEGILEISFFYN